MATIGSYIPNKFRLRTLESLFIWKISFIVKDASTEDMEHFVEVLEDDEFQQQITEETGIEVTVMGVTGAVIYSETDKEDDDGDDDGPVPGLDAASGYIVIAAAAVVVLIVSIFGVCLVTKNKSSNGGIVAIESQDIIETAPTASIEIPSVRGRSIDRGK